MSLTQTIENGVSTAFTALGDLVVKATFNTESNVTYDWSTGGYTSDQSSVIIDAIKVDNNQTTSESTSARSQIIVKSTGIDFSLYNSITINGVTYRIDSFQSYVGATVLEVIQ